MTETKDKPATSKRSFKGLLKKPGKRLFWAWIAYQAIKGTTTTALIWAPLLYYWFHHQ